MCHSAPTGERGGEIGGAQENRDEGSGRLEDPARSLAAVAIASGFRDQSHLTGHFRRAFGTTPAAFRRRSHEAPRD